tara:strand:+ start:575 stop:1846 length:1272 start_codon:yes stop_codon:yes gene_type:complete
MISLYRFLTFFLFPIFSIIIYLRRFINKEDKIRFKEKLSISESDFPKNKKIFWIHAASIGETNSVIPFIQELNKNQKDIFVLLTSTTLSSSQLIKKKQLSQDNFRHRFFPLDNQFLIKKFLNFWKPSLIIFIDSEVWPNYLLEISKRKITLILLNGRITMKTFKRWKLFPGLSNKLFKLYDLCLSSSKESENNLKSLGAKNVKFIGNLKFCPSAKIENNNNNLTYLFKDFYIWCAASTHPGEEEIILKTHNLLKEKDVKLLTIIIPRHIKRSKEIFTNCKSFKLNGQVINNYHEISKKSEVLIINSIGEMTKYFYNCKSVFMGKSFSRKLIKVGGQNPIEPAKCGCKIYHGPYVSNFKEIYDFLHERQIAYKIKNETELSENLIKDFKSNLNTSKKNIEELNNYGEKILTLTTKEILKLQNDI